MAHPQLVSAERSAAIRPALAAAAKSISVATEDQPNCLEQLAERILTEINTVSGILGCFCRKSSQIRRLRNKNGPTLTCIQSNGKKYTVLEKEN